MECSVRGEWFTGLEGVLTLAWKANSKAKPSIPSISQLSALTGITRSNLISFAPVKERRSKATKQDLPPTTTCSGTRHFIRFSSCGVCTKTWRTMSGPFSTHVLNNHPPWPTRYHRNGIPSKRARFTDKQRTFTVEKFQQEERSGRKIGPASADWCWLEEKSNFQ